MSKEDLRSKIIPTTVYNQDENENLDNKRFDTKDLIYLDFGDSNYDEEKTEEELRVSATDYAIMNGIQMSESYQTQMGKKAIHSILTRFSGDIKHKYITIFMDLGVAAADMNCMKNHGICPALHYKLSENENIKEVKDKNGKTIYHTINIGEYPKTKVNKELEELLENLYNRGKVKEGLEPTGRWYSGNGAQILATPYAGKHSPEFEYAGNKYVRVISYPIDKEYKYSNGTIVGEKGTANWVEVKPMSFIIKNWDEMPKSINPNGTGRAKYFDLRAEEAIISGIMFHPGEIGSQDQYTTMWQNSTVRGFLNGIDVRNIKENGAQEYGVDGGGNYLGECNFLNEAFNLSRQPIMEYAIPDSEIEIPDDAFNGCITLKKLIIHDGVKSIGKRAFEGLDFKCAYKTKNGEIIFDNKIPENIEEYTEIIELDKIKKPYERFDYNIVITKNLEGISNLSDTLNKNKFKIPFIYASELVEKNKTDILVKNSDFRFFKNELPDINKQLLDFPQEERLDFYKFANSIGCFSKEKMIDKQGKETNIELAQKASSLMANILKTDRMKLRQISWIIRFTSTRY